MGVVFPFGIIISYPMGTPKRSGNSPHLVCENANATLNVALTSEIFDKPLDAAGGKIIAP
jgi:hypothetical protein